ncbi:hypothetical protein WOC76_23865 [Methylocystis sp. IM3]|uniref:hypothetical protein n=1 Tax=unclassified Methylocystis TaxID=2625913 RepID=UPI00311A81D5
MHDAEAIEVGGDDLVGDIAMCENQAGFSIDDNIRRDAAVRATDPEEFWLLAVRELFEKFGLAACCLFGPSLVFKEEFLMRSHLMSACYAAKPEFGLLDL